MKEYKTSEQEDLISRKSLNKLNAIFKEFDRIYGEYEEFVKHEEWGNANDARSYMMGMAQCMQILWTKEMGEATFQEVERRCGLATGSIPVNRPLAQEVTETVCDDLCKYRDTAEGVKERYVGKNY